MAELKSGKTATEWITVGAVILFGAAKMFGAVKLVMPICAGLIDPAERG